MRKALGHLVLLLVRIVLVVALLLALALLVITQTSAGKERVIREVVQRLENGIRGEVEIQSVSSPGLLRGFSLRGVTIKDEDGRTFLEADSLRGRISAVALLRGDLVFSGVRLWGPRVILERLNGQENLNVVRIFAGGESADTLALPGDTIPPPEASSGPEASPTDSSGATSDTLPGAGASGAGRLGRTVLLRNARIHGGTLIVRLPLSPGESSRDGILTEPGPDGRPAYRRMTFTELELDLGQAFLKAPGRRGERFEIRSLSFEGEVWPTPFRITDLQGEMRREGDRLAGVLETLELPASRARGQLNVQWDGDGGIRVSLRGEADPLTLEDLVFIEDRLPRGTARGPFAFQLEDSGVFLDFQGTNLTSSLGDVVATGGLFLGDEIRFRNLDLTLDGVDLAITDPWVQDTLPLRGWLDGDLSLSGSTREMDLEGLVRLTDPDSLGTMTVDLVGRVGIQEGFSASSLQLTAAPMDWGAMTALSPEIRLRGPGSIRMILTGSLEGDGLGLDGELTHFSAGGGVGVPPPLFAIGQESSEPTGGASRVTVVGRVQKTSAGYLLNLTGDLSPLSLTSVRRSFPSIPFQGEYQGRVEARGLLSDLELRANLNTSGGPLRLVTRFDVEDISRSYLLEAEVDDGFALSELLPFLPEPTRFSGVLRADGRGFSLDRLEGEGRLEVRRGELGPLQVDSAVLAARIQDGVLHVREMVVETEAGWLEGHGSFAMASGAPDGELQVDISSESVTPLRPFIMEDPELILDELTALQRRLLPLEGVDLDTLPTAAEVAMEGAVQGELTLRGGARRFSVEGLLSLENLRFRTDYLEAGSLSLTLENLPGPGERLMAQIDADSLSVRSFSFSGGTAEVDLRRSGGGVRVTARRSDTEEYFAQGTYALDTVGSGVVNIDQVTLQFDTVRWNLGGPSSLSWGSEGYRIRDFQLIRPGVDRMRIRADGFVPSASGGEGDLTLDAERVHLSRLARLLQVETPFEGLVDLHGRMTGSSDDPRVFGTANGEELRFGDFSLGRLEAELDYRAQRAEVELGTYEGEREVLTASGFFPADLRLEPSGRRIPDGPIDLTVAMDSFPAAVALAFMESLEGVEGNLAGTLHFGGTSSDIRPRGTMTLTQGAAQVPALGVRHREVDLRLQVEEDRVVAVEGTSRAGGTARISGTLTLVDPLSNPELDLRVEARDLLAVNRRDVRGRLSGYLDIAKRYRQPQVTGELSVQEGVLMVEEVARSVEVVDLSDPAFFDVVDTTLVTLQPIIRASQNPFLQNLMLDVELTMAQDSWLRGRDLNVEMEGTLDVYWDRMERDMAFLGVLDAVRGVYSVLGRQFHIQDGTVSFPGTPGINPDLDIRAVNTVRTPDNEPLDIIASVEGSLLEPRVSLSSNSTFAIAESDLVSYLIFGQPSYALASGESAVARGTAQVFAGATANLAVGLFSSELGSVLARDVGLDFLAITQNQSDRLGVAGWRTSTQVEIGQYLTDDIFATVQWRPWTEFSGQDRVASLKLETRLSDHWTLEGYWEDRFLRRGLYGLRDRNLYDKVLGFFLYREWGY